jgi:hypothetical protein
VAPLAGDRGLAVGCGEEVRSGGKKKKESVHTVAMCYYESRWEGKSVLENIGQFF